MQEYERDVARVKQQGLIEARLDGPSFGKNGGGPDGYPPYRVRNLTTVRLLAEAISAGGRSNLGRDGQDKIVFLSRAGEPLEVRLIAHPPAHGPAYVSALRSVSADLMRDTRERVRGVARQVRWVQVHPASPLSPATEVRKRRDVDTVIWELQNLSPAAFTFGEGGGAVYVTLHLSSGKKEALRLRPALHPFEGEKRLKNPPLPPVLWRSVLSNAYHESL